MLRDIPGRMVPMFDHIPEVLREEGNVYLKLLIKELLLSTILEMSLRFSVMNI